MVTTQIDELAPTCEVIAVHPEAVAAARASALKGLALQQVSTFFSTLSDPTRLRILIALHQRELCVCDLAAVLDSTSSAVSHQLRILRLSNLVASRRQGKIIYYRLNDEHVTLMIRNVLDHLYEGSTISKLEASHV